MVELGQTKAGSNIWLRMALLEIILEILKTIRALKSEIILKIMYFLIILNLIFIKVTNCPKNVCLKIYHFLVHNNFSLLQNIHPWTQAGAVDLEAVGRWIEI